jgi:hypothetical protein
LKEKQVHLEILMQRVELPMFNKLKIAIAMAFVALAMAGGVARAEQSSGVGAQSAHLKFAVNIPQRLLLRVGSAGGTVDTVTFNVTDIPENQPTVTGDAKPTLLIAAMTSAASTITLSADSSTPMTGGSKDIPLSKINFAASAPFNVAPTAFSGSTNQQVWKGTGPGVRQGSMDFKYIEHNTYDYHGNYTGSVTFTLASP